MAVSARLASSGMVPSVCLPPDAPATTGASATPLATQCASCATHGGSSSLMGGRGVVGSDPSLRALSGTYLPNSQPVLAVLSAGMITATCDLC